MLEKVDDRRDYGEERIVAIGKADGIMLTLVYTDRIAEDGHAVRRIIRPAGVTAMSGERTSAKRRSSRPTRGRATLERLRSQTEEEIAATSPTDLADLPGDFWDRAIIVTPPAKEAISLRVDQDVLAWFRAGGSGYQTRMNAVLRAYMEAVE